MLKPYVAASTSFSEVVRKLGRNPHGGSLAYIRSVIVKYNLDTSHFTGTGWQTGKTSRFRKPASKILVRRSKHSIRLKGAILRRALLEIGRPYKCEKCDNDGEWQGEVLLLPVDHLNGDWTDNTPENLRFLCPNCHSQTENFGAKATAAKNQVIAYKETGRLEVAFK